MGILDKLIPKNTNIFGATTPTYLSGIVDKDQLDLANKQSLFQGLLGTALGYIAQPKNQGYGSSLPYLAKSYMQGMQMAQSPYDRLERDVVMKEKFDQMALDKKREQDRKNLIANMYTTIPAETITTSTYQPIDQVGPGGERAIAPSYAPSQTTEVTVTPAQKILNQQKLMDFALQYPDQGGKFVDTITKLDALNRPQGTTQLSMQEKLKRNLPLTTEYQMNKEGTITAIAGTEKKPIDVGVERNARAVSLVDDNGKPILNPNTGLPYESFMQLPVELRDKVNAEIDLVKANNAKSMGGLELSSGANTEIDKQFLENTKILSQYNNIQKLMNPDYFNYKKQGQAYLLAKAEKGGRNLTKDEKALVKGYTKFKTATLQQLNDYIVKITGAAIGQGEEEARLKSSVPNKDDSQSEFESKMEFLTEDMKKVQARLYYLKSQGYTNFKEGFKKIAIDDMPQIMTKRENELIDQFLPKGESLEERPDIENKILTIMANEFGLGY